MFGSTLIGLGVWMRSDRGSVFYLSVLQNVPVSPLVTLDRFPVIIIVIGSLVAVLSFLGCCGACVESVCFLCLVNISLYIKQIKIVDKASESRVFFRLYV